MIGKNDMKLLIPTSVSKVLLARSHGALQATEELNKLQQSLCGPYGNDSYYLFRHRKGLLMLFISSREIPHPTPTDQAQHS